MRRQLRSQGGIMQLETRQPFIFGGVVKSVKKAVSGAVDTVTDFAKSDVGKAALLAAGVYTLGGGFGAGGFSFGNLPGAGFFGKGSFNPLLRKVGGDYAQSAFGSLLSSAGRGITGALTGGLTGKNILKTAGIGAGLLGGAALATEIFGSPQAAQEAYQRDPEVVKMYLKQYYKNINSDRADKPGFEEEAEEFARSQLGEYAAKQDLADGGRVGFQQGGSFDFNKFLQDRTKEAMQVQGIGQAIRPVVESNVRAQAARDLSQAARGGDIESFLRGQLGSGIIPGMSAIQSPMSGTSNFGRRLVLDALTKSYMNQYGPSYSTPTDSVYDQMRFAPPGQSGSFVQMPGGQYAPYGSGSGEYGIVIDGKRYATEQEAIDDVGLERYNMFFADGGRVGFEEGGTFLTMEEAAERDPAMFMDTTTYNPIPADADRQGAADIARIIMGISDFPREEGEIEDDTMSSTEYMYNEYLIPKRKELMENFGLTMEEADDLIREEMLKLRDKKADGGMPTGIMRLNQAGVKERDYREDGGFVPVGIKEKADDVPAMLSKNEFVMTADAVRGAGNGDVEKGAQRMYKVMKTLENGGRI